MGKIKTYLYTVEHIPTLFNDIKGSLSCQHKSNSFCNEI